MKRITWLCLLIGHFYFEAQAGTQLYLNEPGKQPTSHRRKEPWKQWANNPLFIPISVGITNVYAATNTTIDIKLADGLTTANGYDCSAPTNAATLVANVNVRREYVLSVVASNLSSVDLNLHVHPTWQPLDAKGKRAAPKEYTIFIDHQLGSAFTVGASCTYYSNSWVIEVRDKQGAHWYADDGSDDPGPAAGDGAFPMLGPGKSLATNKAAIDWSVSLGRLFDGTAAGRLRLRQLGLSRETYTPTNIYYTADSQAVRDQVELVVPGLEGVLRQVKAYQAFVDIVAVTNQTTLNFYKTSQVATNKDANGVYTNISGSPFDAWIIRNPEPATTNKLHIIESRNGLSSTNSVVYDPTGATNTWTLRYGTGAEERMETRGVTFSYSPYTNRLESVTIQYASSNTPAYKCIEKYRMFDWGWELTETDGDPDNNNLVTTFDFNNDTGDPFSYGKPSIIRYPDGYWENRLYFNDPYSDYFPGALKYVLRPDKNQPPNPEDATPDNCYAVQYNYDSDSGDFTGTYHFRQGTDYTNRFRIEDNYTFPYSDVDVTTEVLDMWTGDNALGVHSASADESQGNGLTGHSFYYQNNRDARMAMYYHTGVYNPTSGVFTVNTNIDVGTSKIGDGPDWRQSILYYGYPLHLEDGEDQSVEVYAAEGQSLTEYAGDTGLPLAPMQSHKEARIYQNGSLVRRELSVFTGVATNEPLFEVYQSYVYSNDSLGHPTNVTVIDGADSSVTRTIYQADYKGTNVYDCELRLWESDENGMRTEYQYDSLKRMVQVKQVGVAAVGGFPAQADIVATTSYDAYGRQIRQVLSSGSLALTNTWIYDIAGRLTQNTGTNGLTSSVAYQLGGMCVVTTNASGATDIRTNYLDRRLYSKTGTGVVQEFHDYWQNYTPEDDPNVPTFHVTMMEKTTFGSEDSARWKKTGTDWLDLPVHWETPDYVTTNSVIEYHFYESSLNQPDLIRRSGKANQWSYIDYDGSVGKTRTGSEGWLDTMDRISRTLTGFEKVGSAWFLKQTNFVYLSDNSAAPTIASITQQRLSGFSATNILSELTTWDADTNATLTTAYVDRATKKVTEVIDLAQSTLNATNITINGLLQTESTSSVSTPIWHYYDALGCETTVVNSLGFTSSKTYDQFGRLTSVVNFTGNQISYDYYPNGVTGAGQVKSETRGNSRKTYYSYTARGELYRSWGDVPYPQERVYSAYGELVELHTYRGGSGWNGSSWPGSPGSADKTTWTYQPASGLLLSKTDHNTNSVSFTYTNGMLLTRTWARGVTVTNFYNDFGDLAELDYSDTTPSMLFTNYSRASLPQQIIGATGTNNLVYDHAHRLVSATGGDGIYNGITVSNHYNAVYGRDVLQVSGLSSTLTNQFDYDANGRLSTVSNGIYSAAYSYLAKSDLLQTTTSKSNATTVLTATCTWDYGQRLGSIKNVIGGTTVTAHNYLYDGLNRRTQATLVDGSHWKYGYDDRNEVISGKRYWVDWTPVAGQQFEYTYDTIGNRTTAKAGGDASGSSASLRSESYTANALNQYSSKGVAGAVDVIGAGYATATVTVNGNTTYRKGEYYRNELTITNGGGPVFQSVTNTATQGTNSTKIVGSELVPPATQNFYYDADGNLTNDSVWVYRYDAENRLIQMTNLTTVMTNARTKLVFTYDNQGRRATKKVYAWDSTDYSGTPTVDERFIYDGWNLIAKVSATNNTLIQSYTWGKDLGGEMDGAGGVGGLLIVKDHSGSTYHFLAYDGNGNVMALINTADNTTSAQHEYSPFGETIRATGLLAKNNPFRFSTKFVDEESGLIYYGHRYFSPSTGKWLGKDPEEQTANYYLFNFNNPVMRIDTLGAVSYGLDSQDGFHVHDYVDGRNVSYTLGVDANGNWIEDARSAANLHPYYPDQVAKSMQKIMSDPKEFARMHTYISENYDSVFSAAGRESALARGVRITGKTVRGLGKAAGVLGAAFAIMTVVTSSDAMAETAMSYGRHVQNGESAYADLDAIDIAVTIQNTGGNYFITMNALDILLQ